MSASRTHVRGSIKVPSSVGNRASSN
jgi:hypothetical protein